MNAAIKIGSKNEVKVCAVKELIKNYDFLSNAEIVPIESSSDVSEQPVSLDETIKGAMNRAKNAFYQCDYSFGIEDGLIKVPYAKSDYMNVCACAIYDGKNFHIGLSSAFEYPKKITNLVFEKGLDISEAFYKAGLTKNPKIGSSEGTIGILTNGRINRKEYAKQAIMMALIHLENSDLF